MSIEFVADDPQQLYDQVIATMESELGEILNPGDERRVVAGNIMAVLLSFMNGLNAAGNAQLLRYSYGQYLERLGELWGVTRLPAVKAQAVIEFEISAPSGVQVEIPAGTRITPDGVLYFETTQAVSVPWDTVAVSVAAMATVAGVAHNGIAAGAINTLVDPTAYVAGVANTTISSGGADSEDDESLRARIRLSPEGLSVAGPAGAYVYWAKSAAVDIGDVSVSSPSPGQVKVVVLRRDGQLPSTDLLEQVQSVLSADTRRPLTDQVIVAAPEQVEYGIEATYYISASDATDEFRIKSAVEAAAQEYIGWQSSAMGRAVNPDELRRRVLSAGAYRLDVTAPSYQAITVDEVAALDGDGLQLNYGGLL